MTREEEIRIRYERELENMRREQSACNHDWDEIKYDPEIKRVACEFEQNRQGVDCWLTPTKWKDEKIDRWSRVCKKCGKVEYTKEQQAVKYEPKFS